MAEQLNIEFLDSKLGLNIFEKSWIQKVDEGLIWFEGDNFFEWTGQWNSLKSVQHLRLSYKQRGGY